MDRKSSEFASFGCVPGGEVIQGNTSDRIPQTVDPVKARKVLKLFQRRPNPSMRAVTKMTEVFNCFDKKKDEMCRPPRRQSQEGTKPERQTKHGSHEAVSGGSALRSRVAL